MSALQQLRRTPPLLILLVVLTALAGCNRQPIEQGLYYYGHEVNVVCPCGSTDCYWLRGEQPLLSQLRLYVQKQTSEPYQPVFLEYRGQRLAEPGTGYAANYEGYLELREILSVSVDLPADCQTP